MKVVTLNIGLTVEVIDTEMISATRRIALKSRSNLKDEWQLTSQQINDLNSFLTTVVGIIESRGFDVIDDYQSPMSYSYYIQFRPRNQYTDETFRLDVKFRLSDHKLSDAIQVSRNSEADTKQVIFRSYVVEGVKQKSITDVIHTINDICNHLAVGDYSILDITESSDSDNTLITL